MPHLAYPIIQFQFVDGSPFSLEDLQNEVNRISQALSSIPGAFDRLSTELNLNSTNANVLRAALVKYKNQFEGTEVPHGGGGDNGNENGGGPNNPYRVFEPGDISETLRTKVTSGLFSGGLGSLTTFFTQSNAGARTGSYLDIYDKDINSDSTAEVQFSVGYANVNGSGSVGNTTKTIAGNRETAALYKQFANILLPPGTDKFTFTGAGSTSDDFYFVVFNRARMREKVDPGNWEIKLHCSGSGPDNVINFGSNLGSGSFDIRLIDDSGATTNVDVNQGGRVFNVVTGSITSGTAVIDTTAANQPGGAYGLFYPDLGIILLNRDILDNSASLGETTRGPNNTLVHTPTSSNAFDFNSQLLYNSIKSGSYFAARREEEISSTSYFARVKNQDFNFSNNPTFTSASAGTEGGTPSSTGKFTQATFEKDPKVYITQVGLYNDSNELLAIAKLSQPVLKTFAREAVIKVKLDF